MEPDARQPDLEPDERIASLVNEYFDRRQAGEELTPQQFASEHPELAGELQPYLDGLSLLDQIRSSTPDVQAAIEAVPAPGRLPTVEGYELHEEQGRGGMGVVYKALQVSTKRIVALKVLLAGPFASVAAQRRFEREVELAARLRHPSIVTVLESRQVSTGQQYFAMDYVDGMHLDTYVSRVQPDVRSTLGLFVQVCGAVEYAHRHGVVHRDLKPANLLIDEHGQPHILDFGLAKAMDRGEAEDSATGPASASGQVMGTLKYLSPEQAAGAPAEVDVRTDVYALGVMLYQALTGALPYDTTGRPSEVIRRIQESLPKAPSLVCSRVDGELETILLKALEKDKGRRYQSVGDMGEDLQRYLAGETILAKRSSRWYVLREKVSKHRSRAAVAAAALALGLLGVWSGALWSHHAIEQRRVRELFEARRNVLRIQRGLEAGELEAVLADAYTAVGRYPQVIEARLVAAQARFEADRVRPEPEEEDENLGIMPGPIWLLKNELQRDPSLWPCRLLLAQIYRYRADEETGDLARADELEAQVKREAPDTAEAWYLKSFTELNLREPLRYVRRALARDPTHALSWERLSYLADQIGEFESALEGAQRLIRLDRDNPEWPVFHDYILAKMREMELEPEESGQPQASEPQDAPSQGGSAGLTPDGVHLPEPFPQQTPPEASPAEDPTPPTTGAATDGV